GKKTARRSSRVLYGDPRRRSGSSGLKKSSSKPSGVERVEPGRIIPATEGARDCACATSVWRYGETSRSIGEHVAARWYRRRTNQLREATRICPPHSRPANAVARHRFSVAAEPAGS